MKLNMIGNIFGQSGYANHFRGLVNAIYKINKDIHLDIPLPQGWELQVTDNELAMIKTKRFKDGNNIMITMPQFWDHGKVESGKTFTGFLVWEGDKIPTDYLDCCNMCDNVFVPSTHTKKALRNTGYKDNNIHVIPHGVDTSLFAPQVRKEGESKDSPFTFIANKGWAQGTKDRGGLQFLFKAFSEEFGKDENVRLLVKINAAYCPPGWDLTNEMNKLNLPEDRPLIHINTENIKFDKMPGLYHQGDCFVSSTMGEAFSLPCAEAMSCGVPVITTNFGGQTDFVTDRTGWLIDSEPIENTWDVAYEGINWAMPDKDHLRKLLRHAFKNKEECKEKGKAAREYVEENLTWDKSAEKLLKVFK